LHSDPKEHGILNSICNNLHSDPKEHGILNSICNNLHSDPKEHGKRWIWFITYNCMVYMAVDCLCRKQTLLIHIFIIYSRG